MCLLQHIGEMTVRETFDFAARCQGAGTKKGDFGGPLLASRISRRMSSGYASSQTDPLIASLLFLLVKKVIAYLLCC